MKTIPYPTKATPRRASRVLLNPMVCGYRGRWFAGLLSLGLAWSSSPSLLGEDHAGQPTILVTPPEVRSPEAVPGWRPAMGRALADQIIAALNHSGHRGVSAPTSHAPDRDGRQTPGEGDPRPHQEGGEDSIGADYSLRATVTGFADHGPVIHRGPVSFLAVSDQRARETIKDIAKERQTAVMHRAAMLRIDWSLLDERAGPAGVSLPTDVIGLQAPRVDSFVLVEPDFDPRVLWLSRFGELAQWAIAGVMLRLDRLPWTVSAEDGTLDFSTITPLNPGQPLAREILDQRGVMQLTSIALLIDQPHEPVRITEVPVDRPVRRIVFLHDAAWLRDNGAEATRYVVHYVTGSSVEVPLVRDARGQGRVARSTFLLQGDGQLHYLTWVNSRPEVAVQSVEFITGMKRAEPFFFAITVEQDPVDPAREGAVSVSATSVSENRTLVLPGS